MAWSGPLATRLKEIIERTRAFYKIIQSVLVAHLHGNAAQISVEIGRGNVPSAAQPQLPRTGGSPVRGRDRRLIRKSLAAITKP